MLFIVRVVGKLLVEASDKKLALEKANVFLANKNFGGFKSTDYGTEEVNNTSIIPV